MNASIAPPEELAGELCALIVPFAEEIAPDHINAPLVYHMGDLKLPRKPIPLRAEHDDGSEIGYLSSFVADRRTGIWAKVKLGHTAEDLVARGYDRVSAEIDDGKLTGVALVPPVHDPAFPSARIFGAPTARAADAAFWSGPITIGPGPKSPPPAVARQPAMDMGAHRRALAGLSTAAVDAEVARARRAWEDRKTEFAELALEAEEEGLRRAWVPVHAWPPHLPHRRRWDAFQQQLADARAALVETTRMFQVDLEGSARRVARLPWWRRWFR